jgi:hypothetical protein
MTCYDEFPVSTVIYNWATAGGVMVLGAAAAGWYGIGALFGYVLLLAAAMMGILATVCARCESYYGRRCGLGLGKVVPLFFKRGRTDLYLRTSMQLVYVILFLVAMVWPIVGNAVLLVGGFGVGRLAELVAAVVLLLAFAVPHPKLVCIHCKQGECGACPVGRIFWRK